MEFPEEEFVVRPLTLETTIFERAAGSRREHSMNLNNNVNHVHHVIHTPSQTEFYICYAGRIVRSKRVLGMLKKSLPPGFAQSKLTSKKLFSNAAFRPLMEYFPEVIKNARDRRKVKSLKESFSSAFMVLYKDPNNTIGFLHLSLLSLFIRKQDPLTLFMNS